jgi:hypothetical protein
MRGTGIPAPVPPPLSRRSLKQHGAFVTFDSLSPQPERCKVPEDDSDAINRTQREQTLSTPYRDAWLRADAEFRRYAAIAVAQRSQPRVWPPPPGPSAFQRSDIAARRRDRIEVAAARWLQRRTPGSALWGLIVLPPGDTRVGSMTLTVNRIDARRIDACRCTARRPRARRSHRAVAKRTVGGDSGDSDGEPPEPRARGPPPRAWDGRVLKSRPLLGGSTPGRESGLSSLARERQGASRPQDDATTPTRAGTGIVLPGGRYGHSSSCHGSSHGDSPPIHLAAGLSTAAMLGRQNATLTIEVGAGLHCGTAPTSCQRPLHADRASEATSTPRARDARRLR